MTDQASQQTDIPKNTPVEYHWVSEATTLASSIDRSGPATQGPFDTQITPEGFEALALLASQSQAAQQYASGNEDLPQYYAGFPSEMEVQQAAMNLMSVSNGNLSSLYTGNEAFIAQDFQQSHQQWSYEEAARQFSQQNSQVALPDFSQQYSQGFAPPSFSGDHSLSSQQMATSSGAPHQTQGQVAMTSYEMTQQQELLQSQYNANVEAYNNAQLQQQPVAQPDLQDQQATGATEAPRPARRRQ